MPDKQLLNILIVEDDEDDFVLTESLLASSETWRFNIDWASTPARAQELLAGGKHDICLMDYQLGGEVGIDLVKQAISGGFSAPIIMLTGQENPGVELAAAEAGAVDYLVKDRLASGQLFRAIRYALVRNDIQSERLERNRAEFANRAKSEFLANLSHEIRTPLTAIVGYTELLIEQYRDSDHVLGEKLGAINRNGKHLLSLLNDTLDLSKIEAGKLEIDPAPMEVNEFLLDLFSVLGDAASRKGLELRIVATTPLPVTIHSDETRLRQILLNLLGNAIKFTEQGSVTLEVTFLEEQGRNLLCFAVRDTGSGIVQSDLERIFKPFVQGSVPNGTIRGTGLGLTISQRLAEKLGGHIEADSTIGKGSEFRLCVDAGAVDVSAMVVPALETGRRKTDSPYAGTLDLDVLVVDDVVDVRELLASILRLAGCRVAVAATGEEALAVVAASGADTFDLVLMDLNMPGIDGYEALRQLRQRHEHLPVIALTAGGLRGEREKCRDAGFDDYLTKPVAAHQLLARIRAVLSQVGVRHNTRNSEAGNGGILVLEDHADSAAALAEILELMGYDVRIAADLQAARRMLQEDPPAIFLSDLHIGMESSGPLLQEIRRHMPSTRCILMSGKSAADIDIDMADVDGFLEKPVTTGKLRQLLSTN